MPPPNNAPSAAKSAAVVVGTARPIVAVLDPTPEGLLVGSLAAALLRLSLSQPACSETTYVCRQSNDVGPVRSYHTNPCHTIAIICQSFRQGLRPCVTPRVWLDHSPYGGSTSVASRKADALTCSVTRRVVSALSNFARTSCVSTTACARGAECTYRND